MRFAPRTILGQLIAGSVSVQVLVFGMFLTVGVRREFRQTQARDRDRLANQAGTLAGALQEPLAAGDRKTLAALMRVLPVSTTIKGVRITDATGETLQTSSNRIPAVLNAHERALLPALLASPGYRTETDAHGALEAVLPVTIDGAVKGIVWVVPDAHVTLRYPVAALRNVLIYGALALICNLLAVWVLSATMVRPLRLLRHATMQVQHDPNDLSAFPLPVVAMNEAGELTASFNAIINEIALQRRGTRETLSLLDAMLSRAPIGFAFYDRDLRYVRLNEHLAQMHGVPADEHIGLRYGDLLPKNASTTLAEASEALIARVFASGEPVSDQEMSGAVPGGGHRTYLASYFPVLVAGNEVRWVGVIAKDITERKRAEDAMRRSEKLAAAGRLAASIAHEINSPLESVTNLLYLLRQHPSMDKTALEYTALAQQELSHVAEITQQTLRFYRHSTHPLDVHLQEVLQSVLVLHQGRMLSPRIEVQSQFSDDPVLFGYAGELREVFANLIGNAIDALPSGGCIWIRARDAQRAGRKGVRVTVADTGTGMSEEVRRRIFEPFFTTKEATGTGLGLWVSAEILAKHCATTQVRSRPARYRGDLSGTVFSMFFPYDGVPRRPVRVATKTQMQRA